ncbi:MAG: IPT/TIG domain-containing protein [Actinobacteria bacterium]|nr:IPT/TIG domain-containing protein [Actinomycetota bacterium]MCL6105461.1 IPT/TIG domain-containing protein [Actinomycetota bacterium]
MMSGSVLATIPGTAWASGVNSVSVTETSAAQEASGVSFSVSFTTTNSLSAGDTITLYYPLGLTIPSSTSDYAISDTTHPSDSGTATGVSFGDGYVVVKIPIAIPGGDAISLDIYGITNPSAGTYNVWVATETDTTPIETTSPFKVTLPQAVSVPSTLNGNPNPSFTTLAGGANGVMYVVGFVLSSTGALVGSQGTITLAAPPGTVFPPTSGSYLLTDTTTTGINGPPLDVYLASPSTVTVVMPQNTTHLAQAGDSLELTIDGVVNPAASPSSGYEIEVSTSSDTLPASSSPYDIYTPLSVGSPTITQTSTAAGAQGVAYALSFDTSSMGNLVGNDSSITVTGPPGTVFPPSSSDYFIYVGYYVCPSSGASCGVTLFNNGAGATISLPNPIGSGSPVVLTIGGVTNPDYTISASSGISVEVSTSSDLIPIPFANYQITTPSSVSTPTLSSSSTTAAGASGVTYDVSFTASSQGGLIGEPSSSQGPYGSVTLQAPFGTVFPTSTSDYLVKDGSTAVCGSGSSVPSGTPACLSVHLASNGSVATIALPAPPPPPHLVGPQLPTSTVVVPAGSTATVTVQDVTNSPVVSTTNTIDVSTSSDIVPTPTSSYSTTAPNAPSGLSVVESSGGTPANSNNNKLNSVTCITASYCTAVGYYYNGTVDQTLIESYNGTSWLLATSPDPSTSTNNFLESVTCTSSTDCTAVGYYVNGGGYDQTLIESYNGTSWVVSTSPNQTNSGATTNNFLESVTCTSSTDCTAVGYYVNGGGYDQTLIESYNGTAWSVVTSPNTATTQNNFLEGVTCITASDCTAGGYYYNGTVDQTLIESYNGSTWSVVTSPNTATTQNNFLEGVSCVTSTDCTVVGYYYNGTVDQTLIESYNGTAWSVVTSPNTATTQNNFLEGVTCITASYCTAVGYYYNGTVDQTLIESYNGTSWSVTTSPNQTDSGTATNNSLEGVSCVSSTDCTAVGYYYDVSINQVLVESYNGTSWSIVNAQDATIPGTGTTWAVNFSTSTTGALISGMGAVTISAPVCTVFPTSTSNYVVKDITAGTTPTVNNIVLAANGTAVTFILGTDNINAGDSLSVTITNMIDPISSGSVYVATSSDTAASSGYTIAGAGSSSNCASGVSFAQTTTPTVTLSTTTSEAAIGVSYSVSTITSAFDLSGGSGSMTLDAPLGTVFPSSASDYSVSVPTSPGSDGTASSVILSDNAAMATVTVSQTIYAGNTIDLTINDVTNPPVVSSGLSIGVMLSSQTISTSNPIQYVAMESPVQQSSSYSTVSGATVTQPKVFLNSTSASANGITYVVGASSSMQASATGGLVGGTGTVTVSAPPGTVLPTAVSAYQIIDITNAHASGTVTSLLLAGNSEVATVTVPNNIAAGDVWSLGIAGVVSPGIVTNTDTVSVYSSSDTGNVVSSSYSITPMTSLGALAIKSFSTLAGNASGVTYQIGFTASSTGGLVGGVGTLTLVAQPGTVFPGLTSDYMLNDSTNSSGTAAPQSVIVASTGNLVTMIIGMGNPATTVDENAVVPGDSLTLTVEDVTNVYPSSANTLSLNTSSDVSSASTSYTTDSPNSVGGPIVNGSPTATPTVTLSSYGTDLTGITYTVSFATSALGELIDGFSYIVLSLPPGTVLPSSTSNYSITAGGTPLPSPVSVVLANDNATATVMLAQSSPSGGLGAGDSTNVVVKITGVVNPSTESSSYTLSLSTSSDIVPTTTASYTLSAAPIVTSIFPTAGLMQGGTLVNITGYNFLEYNPIVSPPLPTVDFGSNNPATGVSCSSTTTCTVVSPPAPPGGGAVSLTVTTVDGTSTPVSFTYANAPVIQSVQFSNNSVTCSTNCTYTLTVDGSGFGSPTITVPCSSSCNASNFATMDYAKATPFQNNLTYQTWTNSQIVVGGFTGTPGDGVDVTLWNSATYLGAAWGGNIPIAPVGTPQITSVSFSGSGATTQMTVNGSGFGSAPTQLGSGPFTGDINQFEFVDWRWYDCGSGSNTTNNEGIGQGSFMAGFNGWGASNPNADLPNSVTLNYQSWSNTQIVVNGFSSSYGQGCNLLSPGDPISITVWNSSDTSATGPQTTWATSSELPVISSIAPASGPVSGGTAVDITGSNFVTSSYNTAVYFGAMSAGNVSCSTTTSCTATSPTGPFGGGTVAITLQTPVGASNGESFSYIPSPTISSITPASGLVTGGTTVTLTGTAFSTATGATTVDFGSGNPATGVSCSTTTSCTATSPPGPSNGGPVFVTATTSGGSSGGISFDYTLPAPTVSSLAPDYGPSAGGTSVAISGTNFSTSYGGTTVLFGTTAATSVTCSSTTSCTVTSPAGPSNGGTIEVTVTTGGGASNPVPFTYTTTSTPTVASLVPNYGPVAGGTSVAISGTNFSTASGGTTVLFGTTAATSVSCSSTTSCTATSPAGPSNGGTIEVTVTTGGGTSNQVPFTYTTSSTPTVASLVPNYGPSAGGTSVTISGTNFSTASGGTTVLFGTTAATSVTCSSTTSCTVTSPAGPSNGGTIEVTVTTAGGTSNQVPFTYTVSAPPVSSTPIGYVPLSTPSRICDTRAYTSSGINDQCTGETLTPSNQTLTIAVAGYQGTGGAGDIVPSNATAVVLNVTEGSSTTGGFLTVYPAGSSMPMTSSLNFAPSPPAGPIANLVQVGLGATGNNVGKISITNHSGDTNLIVDVMGYFAPVSSSGEGSFLPLSTPSRICDTRAPNGSSIVQNQCTGQSLVAGTSSQTLTLHVAGYQGTGGSADMVPSGATAVVLNVTEADNTNGGFLTVYPAGASLPKTSNLNFTPRSGVLANGVIVGLSSTGSISIYSHTGSVDVAVDVMGYFTASGGTGSTFYPLSTPSRICDSRPSNGSSIIQNQCTGKSLVAGTSSQTLTLDVAGYPGTGGGGDTVPSGASAVVLNVTEADNTSGGFLTVYPAGGSLPKTSNLNFTPTSGALPNFVTVALGTGSSVGEISIFNHAGSTDVAVDVVGYYYSP